MEHSQGACVCVYVCFGGIAVVTTGPHSCSLTYRERLSSNSNATVHLHYNYSFSKLQPSQDLVYRSATEQHLPHHPCPVSPNTNWQPQGTRLPLALDIQILIITSRKSWTLTSITKWKCDILVQILIHVQIIMENWMALDQDRYWLSSMSFRCLSDTCTCCLLLNLKEKYVWVLQSKF